jgi:hypothetical protein
MTTTTVATIELDGAVREDFIAKFRAAFDREMVEISHMGVVPKPHIVSGQKLKLHKNLHIRPAARLIYALHNFITTWKVNGKNADFKGCVLWNYDIATIEEALNAGEHPNFDDFQIEYTLDESNILSFSDKRDDKITYIFTIFPVIAMTSTRYDLGKTDANDLNKKKSTPELLATEIMWEISYLSAMRYAIHNSKNGISFVDKIYKKADAKISPYNSARTKPQWSAIRKQLKANKNTIQLREYYSYMLYYISTEDTEKLEQMKISKYDELLPKFYSWDLSNFADLRRNIDSLSKFEYPMGKIMPNLEAIPSRAGPPVIFHVRFIELKNAERFILDVEIVVPSKDVDPAHIAAAANVNNMLSKWTWQERLNNLKDKIPSSYKIVQLKKITEAEIATLLKTVKSDESMSIIVKSRGWGIGTHFKYNNSKGKSNKELPDISVVPIVNHTYEDAKLPKRTRF